MYSSWKIEDTFDPAFLARLDEMPTGETVTSVLLEDSWDRFTTEEQDQLVLLPTVQLSDEGEVALFETLGTGGMGSVHRAHQRSLQREIAVKMPRDRKLSNARKLIEEAILTGGLEHPNIVPVHALGRGPNGRPLLMMKHVEGVTWRDLIRNPTHEMWRERDDERLAKHLEVLIQVCHAVEFAHSRGVIHRDIKPANIMLGRFGEVYLLDWGIADYKEGLALSTRTLILGTPAYIAPEMAMGRERYTDERSDVYLLGATLYEVLVGHPPHTEPEVQKALQASANKALLQVAGLEADLAHILGRSTASNPDDRFPSVRAMREAVETHLRFRDVSRLTNQALKAQQALATTLEGLGPQVSQGEEEQLQTLFNEADLLFRMALATRADDPRAREGMQRGVSLMLGHAISRRQEARASLLLARLTEPAPEHVDAVDILRVEVDEQRRAKEALRALRREHDISLNAPTRQSFLLATLVIVALVSVTVLSLTEGGVDAFSHREASFFSVAATLAIGAGVYLVRDRLFLNSATRRLVLGFMTGICVVSVHRLVSWYADAPVAHMLAVDQILMGAVWLSISFGIHRLVTLSGVLTIGFGVASVVAPEWANTLFSFSAILAPWIAYMGMLRRDAAEL